MNNSMEVVINSLKLAFKAKSCVMISSLRTRLYHNLGLESNKDDHDSGLCRQGFSPLKWNEGNCSCFKVCKISFCFFHIKTYEDCFLDKSAKKTCGEGVHL